MKIITASHLLIRTEEIISQAYGLRGIPGIADRAIITLDTVIAWALDALPDPEVAAAHIADILDEMSIYGPWPPAGIPHTLWTAIRDKLARSYVLLTGA